MSSLVLNTSLFARALRQVLPAVAADRQRLSLTGVFIETNGDGLRLAASDAYRLAVSELPAISLPTAPFSVVVATDGLLEMLDHLDRAEAVTLEVVDGGLVAWLGERRHALVTVAGEFPQFDRYLAAGGGARATVQRQGLRDALERLPETPSAVVRGVASGLEIIAGDVTVTVEAARDGDGSEVVLNPEFLYDAAMAFSEPEIVVEVTAPDAPVVVTSTSNESGLTLTYVIMPIRTP